MRFLGIGIKYILWSLFSIIVFVLFVGLAKMNWNVAGYMEFLNTTDWSVFHGSQPATWADPFRPSQEAETSIEDILDTEEESLDHDGFDVFDPDMEEELNAIADDTIDREDEGFGFVTDESNNLPSDDNSTIEQLINQRK